jgi:hypothetical protein
MTNPLQTIGTILTMSDGADVMPFYSARGMKQTLDPIGASNVQRTTVNAQRVNLALSKFKKYQSVISASDVRPPMREDIWPGRIVTVGCAYLLFYATSGGSAARTPVSGSQFIEGNFTFYRPTINFMIGAPQGNFEEWEAGMSWSIPMVEV